jgi:hypothetical protein
MASDNYLVVAIPVNCLGSIELANVMCGMDPGSSFHRAAAATPPPPETKRPRDLAVVEKDTLGREIEIIVRVSRGALSDASPMGLAYAFERIRALNHPIPFPERTFDLDQFLIDDTCEMMSVFVSPRSRIQRREYASDLGIDDVAVRRLARQGGIPPPDQRHEFNLDWIDFHHSDDDPDSLTDGDAPMVPLEASTMQRDCPTMMELMCDEPGRGENADSDSELLPEFDTRVYDRVYDYPSFIFPDEEKRRRILSARQSRQQYEDLLTLGSANHSADGLYAISLPKYLPPDADMKHTKSDWVKQVRQLTEENKERWQQGIFNRISFEMKGKKVPKDDIFQCGKKGNVEQLSTLLLQKRIALPFNIFFKNTHDFDAWANLRSVERMVPRNKTQPTSCRPSR